MLSLIASLALASTFAQDAKPIVCAVMHSAANDSVAKVDFAGARFSFCCGGCDSQFKSSPTKFLAKDALKGDTIGEFLFDPATGLPITPKKAKAWADHGGIRYYFANAAGKTAFAAQAEAFAKVTKESLVCPISGETIKGYASAAGFADFDGVRYYTCCGDCLTALRKDTKGTLAKSKAVVTAPKAMAAPKVG